MNLNIIGSGTASLERMKDGEWVTADKVLEGDSVRINCEPAYGYRVKSIRYNWDKSNPYAITDYVRGVAFRTPFDEEMVSGETFTIPRTYPGMAFRTAYRRLYVDVEFERDLSVHLHELQRVEAKEPSCTEPGNIAHWSCVSDNLPCGKYFADENGVNEKYVIEGDTVHYSCALPGAKTMPRILVSQSGARRWLKNTLIISEGPTRGLWAASDTSVSVMTVSADGMMEFKRSRLFFFSKCFSSSVGKNPFLARTL